MKKCYIDYAYRLTVKTKSPLIAWSRLSAKISDSLFDLSQSQSQMNFSAFDFDFSSTPDFKATETQFKPEPIDSFKKCSQFCTYTISLMLTFVMCQNCIKFKIV